jgi:galactose oxidase
MATPRPYHSFALLLADGRVLEGGGGLCSSSDNCDVNHPNVEIYSPPYLFKGGPPLDQRGARGRGPPTAARSPSPPAAPSPAFALIRVGSVTHSVDTDQRFLRLAGHQVRQITWTVKAPANRNLAPRGFYLLVAMNGDVPSVARS